MSQINIVIFGIGNVGSTLINQITNFNKNSKNKKLNIFCVANSKLALFQNNTTSEWRSSFETDAKPYSLEDIYAFVKKEQQKDYNGIEAQFVAVDVTASSTFLENYIALIEHGFHIVTANKVANTLSYEFYKELREALVNNNRNFGYETNVGAGLPIIETVKSLYESGEEIYKIRGVFSGSLSYLFNNFSKEDKAFSEILLEADALGLTEPDAREDLSGNDVARKLLILGREVGLTKEFSDIKIQSLVPKELDGGTTLPEFRESVKKLDSIFAASKEKLATDEVLRHIGELNIQTQELEVKLVQESKITALGQTQGADAVFEIYTKSYGDQPLVIQGAGAGKEVTARGVLSDILKITKV